MFQPNISADGEVSFTGGYPFDPEEEETVKLTVNGNTFILYVDGEWAWAGGPEEDRKIHDAVVKRGATAVVTGISARGTTTTDTLSLYVFF